MSRRNTQEIVILNAVTPQAVTSSTDATPIVVTKASHGYSTGDVVMINGHTTNVAANGIRRITVVNSSTFSLQDPYTGANIAGSGSGAGSSGVVTIAPKVLSVSDFTNVVLSVATSGNANFTLKPAGSMGKPVVLATDKYSEDQINFGGTQSASNQYQYVQLINLDTAAAVNGATGITSAGTDIYTQYEVNINALKYFTLVLTAWSAGTLTVKALLTDNL